MVRDTIFSPAFGNRPSQLVGRDVILRQLLDGLMAVPGSKERATLLLGQRGMGKTVLLWEIAETVREKNYVVASPTIVSENMLERIIEKIQEDSEQYLNKKKLHLTGANVGVMGFSAGIQFSREEQETKSPEYRLARICRELARFEVNVLILVDEVQANSAELKRLIIAYQELVGEGLPVAIIMAGLPASVSQTLNDKVLTFFNRTRKLDIGPLNLRDINAFYEEAFSTLHIEISSDLCTKAAEATLGSPYLLQLIGHNLVLSASSDSMTVNQDVYNKAIKASQNDYQEDICKTTLAPLSDRDIDFLRAMSKDADTSKVFDIAVRMGVTTDYAQKYRRRLLETGIIEAPRRGVVAFAVPYLADYLRRS
ncbi:MAG: ATP-binding protein [Coriobacteriales bacterium]|nr:ATP-binding protein [Coriobacteriales bacterium]